MNSGGVLSNPETNEKLPMFHNEVTPVFTFENPEILFSLPKKQRQAGVSDTLSHLLETYFGQHADDLLSDRLTEGLMINLIENYESYIAENDYNVHANIFLTATLALNGLTGLGRVSQD